MINTMSAEIITAIIGTVVTIISLSITIYLTNRSTQKILESTAKETQKILREIGCAIAKIRTDSKASAWRNGYAIAEDIMSEEEAKRLGEPYFYDPLTKVCHYKPKKSSAAD